MSGWHLRGGAGVHLEQDGLVPRGAHPSPQPHHRGDLHVPVFIYIFYIYFILSIQFRCSLIKQVWTWQRMQGDPYTFEKLQVKYNKEIFILFEY